MWTVVEIFEYFFFIFSKTFSYNLMVVSEWVCLYFFIFLPNSRIVIFKSSLPRSTTHDEFNDIRSIACCFFVCYWIVFHITWTLKVDKWALKFKFFIFFLHLRRQHMNVIGPLHAMSNFDEYWWFKICESIQNVVFGFRSREFDTFSME